jgi:hypothetical protein
MLFLISYGQNRPSVLDDVKDTDYHVKWARFCVGQANNNYQSEYIERIKLNKRFYKGQQWVIGEDLEAFFKDDEGQDRNRIKIIKNQIRPMVEQYRGNAIRMTINARVKSISPLAITRKESRLSEMLFYSKLANQPDNPFAQSIKDKFPVGKNDGETEEIFENLYEDKYVEKMNYLLDFVSSRNKFEQKQVRIAEELALAGIAVVKNFEQNGHQNFQITESENFFWDRSAAEYDLSDSGFMGEVWYGDSPDIYEKYPNMSSGDRQAVENFVQQWKKIGIQSGGTTRASSQQNKYNSGSKIPVFRVYWKDSEKYEYGYVLDDSGYPYLTKINFVHEGEEEPRYTDKDLVEVKTQRAKKLLRGKLKRKIFVDTMRFCEFIPKEIMASNESELDNKYSDIVLDWGLAPYQETENMDFNAVKFPYKCYCWGYVDGEVLSPIDDAINPQRFINRILSVTENQINNSRGSGIMYDKTALDPEGGEQEMLRNMNQSKPVGFKAKGLGMQNIVSSYDTTIKAGAMTMFNIVDIMKGYIQETTGVNEAMKGESTGGDQLVGVTELLIQRGSLMQEPFYNGITQIFLQCFESIATTGKRIYCDNERNLSAAVGEEGVKIIKISEDMKLEDFKCFVKRDNSDDMLVNAGNQMLMTLFQMQLIDDKIFSNLYDRATPSDVAFALRKAAKERQEIARMQKEQGDQQQAQAQEGMQQMMAQQQNQQHEQQAREDIMHLTDKKHDMAKEILKQMGKIAPNSPAAQKQILDAGVSLKNQPLV